MFVHLEVTQSEEWRTVRGRWSLKYIFKLSFSLLLKQIYFEIIIDLQDVAKERMYRQVLCILYTVPSKGSILT